MIYHIRKPLKMSKRNQWYKDTSDRGNGTFCGAPETEYDILPNQKAIIWGNHEPCSDCIKLRNN